jgi:hypothetical protein
MSGGSMMGGQHMAPSGSAKPAANSATTHM